MSLKNITLEFNNYFNEDNFLEWGDAEKSVNDLFSNEPKSLAITQVSLSALSPEKENEVLSTVPLSKKRRLSTELENKQLLPTISELVNTPNQHDRPVTGTNSLLIDPFQVYKRRTIEKDFILKCLQAQEKKVRIFKRTNYKTFLEIFSVVYDAKNSNWDNWKNIIVWLTVNNILCATTGQIFTAHQINNFMRNAIKVEGPPIYQKELIPSSSTPEEPLKRQKKGSRGNSTPYKGDLSLYYKGYKLALIAKNENYQIRVEEPEFRIKCLQYVVHNNLLDYNGNNPFRNENLNIFISLYLSSNSFVGICREFTKLTNIALEPRDCSVWISKAIYYYGPIIYLDELFPHTTVQNVVYQL